MAVCYFASTLGLKRQWSEGEDSGGGGGESGAVDGAAGMEEAGEYYNVPGAWQHAWNSAGHITITLLFSMVYYPLPVL